MADHDDYEVGYGKPPKQTRFAKGQSGNPRGRPKGAKNVANILAKTSRELVTVTKGGRIVKMCRLEAGLEQLANKAASGDLRAIRELMYWLRIYADAEQVSPPMLALDEKEKPVMTSILKRILQQNDLTTKPDTELPDPTGDEEK
jgi:hypothetical protein